MVYKIFLHFPTKTTTVCADTQRKALLHFMAHEYQRMEQNFVNYYLVYSKENQKFLKYLRRNIFYPSQKQIKFFLRIVPVVLPTFFHMSCIMRMNDI